MKKFVTIALTIIFIFSGVMATNVAAQELNLTVVESAAAEPVELLDSFDSCYDLNKDGSITITDLIIGYHKVLETDELSLRDIVYLKKLLLGSDDNIGVACRTVKFDEANEDTKKALEEEMKKLICNISVSDDNTLEIRTLNSVLVTDNVFENYSEDIYSDTFWSFEVDGTEVYIAEENGYFVWSWNHPVFMAPPICAYKIISGCKNSELDESIKALNRGRVYVTELEDGSAEVMHEDINGMIVIYHFTIFEEVSEDELLNSEDLAFFENWNGDRSDFWSISAVEDTYVLRVGR